MTALPLAVLAGLAGPALAGPAHVAAPDAATQAASGSGWVGTWSTATVQPGGSGLSHTGFTDQTIRNVVHTSVGGDRVRLRFSNVFGTTPLVLDKVYVGVRSTGAGVRAGTERAVSFAGDTTVTIPAGERITSDPISLSVEPASDLVVSIYVDAATGPLTWHPNAQSTNYYADGDHASDTDPAAYTHTDTSWFVLDGVDVNNPAVKGAVVTFGPSTTDGDASTRDANRRYSDDLARRLLALPAGEQLSVLNAGISANQLLADGTTNGQSAGHRWQRDALDQTGVKAIILWEGSNDIGNHPEYTPGDLTDEYQQLIDAAHARGIRVIGATLQPDEGAGYYTPAGDAVREDVNDWIRTSGAFDGVADFDRALLDPADPKRMLPAYDSGDHLHPNDTGYQQIADTINLALFAGQGEQASFWGTARPSTTSLTLGTGSTSDQSVAITSYAGRSVTLHWRAETSGTVSVQPAAGILRLGAGATAQLPLTVVGGATTGSDVVRINLSLGDTSALATQFAVVVQKPGDLSPFYNNTGISDDGAVGEGNLDGGGYSYSAQALAAAGIVPGGAVHADGFDYTWPDVPSGRPDNVQTAGQTVVPDTPAGSAYLGFLGTGSNSGTVGSEGDLTITYTDGTTSTEPLGLSGYALGFGGTPQFGNVVVVTLPYRNKSDGTRSNDKMYVFSQRVPIDPSKTVASVTLPSSVSRGQLHVFDIAAQ
ncbi:SGNH/GDSL hydrolase family protein [Nocardioides sp. KR10-350]|uniref:SGNH/GDSL hydrolase family protein n=1 Tax=Nocardioides cheoyonin TaxID=3156615 RepID=UPI0032B314EA